MSEQLTRRDLEQMREAVTAGFSLHRADEVRLIDEVARLRAIVERLAAMNPMQDIETAYVCFACSYWERRAGDRGDDGAEPPTEHDTRCVWRQAREAVG